MTSKSIQRFLPICLFAASAALAHADEPEISPSPEELAKRLYMCTPADSHFRIAYLADEAGSDRLFVQRRIISLPEIEWVGNPATDVDVRRKGSGSLKLSCGEVSILLTTGFFNANPQGELGAADDFAVIDVSAGGRTRQFQMSDYWCPENGSRSASMLPNNVGAIEGRRTGRGYELSLTKTACDANYKARIVTETIPF
jgi:hypothetical protein